MDLCKKDSMRKSVFRKRVCFEQECVSNKSVFRTRVCLEQECVSNKSVFRTRVCFEHTLPPARLLDVKNRIKASSVHFVGLCCKILDLMIK
jgi:hypothetical protein